MKIIMILLLLFFKNYAFSDMVYFKNGNSLEGIIEKDDNDKIVLKIDNSRIVIDKSEIDKISRYKIAQQNSLKNKWEKENFMNSAYIPKKYKNLVQEYKKLENNRNFAIESKKNKNILMKKISDSEMELELIIKNISETGTQLKTMKAEDDVLKYNQYIKDFNSAVIKKESNMKDQENLKKEITECDKKISDYINNLEIFKTGFIKNYSMKTNEKEKSFIEEIKKNIGKMDKDFTIHTINYKEESNGMVIEVLLNNTLKTKLILDTGASLVVISKNVVKKLGINIDEKDTRTITCVLADGRKARAFPIIISSMKLQNVEVKNVEAAVFEDNDEIKEDGLLGMSFLQNFTLKLNPQNKVLILEKFNP